MVHDRHDAFGIDGEKCGRGLLEVQELDVVTDEIHAFLIERDDGLTLVGVWLPVINVDHDSSPRGRLCGIWPSCHLGLVDHPSSYGPTDSVLRFDPKDEAE
jgi:hypothetical protein